MTGDDTGFDPYSDIELPQMIPTARIAEALPPALASEYIQWAYSLHGYRPSNDDLSREVFTARCFGSYGVGGVLIIVNGSPPRSIVMVSTSAGILIATTGNGGPVKSYRRDSSGIHQKKKYAEGVEWLQRIGFKITEFGDTRE